VEKLNWVKVSKLIELNRNEKMAIILSIAICHVYMHPAAYEQEAKEDSESGRLAQLLLCWVRILPPPHAEPNRRYPMLWSAKQKRRVAGLGYTGLLSSPAPAYFQTK